MAETNTELDAFLSGGAQPGSGPSAATAPEPEAPPAPEPEQKADAADGGDKKPPDAAPEPEEAPDHPGEDGKIAFQAFERERARRNDWKEKAVRAETERDELRRQLEEAKRAAAQPPPQPQYQPPPPEIPNPAHDPAGYHAYIQQERIRDSINDRLNLSEVMAVKEHGREKVEAMKREFLAAKEADPRLGEELIKQIDPYGWAMEQLDVIRTRQEIGSDPAAYRERIRAEAIAEFQKNGGVMPQHRVSPAAGMAPSLANQRSVAGRSAPAFTGPPSLDDIVASIHRK